MNHSPEATEESPHNPKNRLIDGPALRSILERYDHPHPDRVNLCTFRRAFTHRSYCTRKNENFVQGNQNVPEGCEPLQEESLERLEFLGDAVLNLVVAEYLFERYPDENEGFLSRMRTNLVNGVMLAELCLIAGLEPYVLISKQIEDSGGRLNKSVLEDAFEAFLGAMFVDAGRFDAGYIVAKRWLVAFLEANVDFRDLVTNNPGQHKEALTRVFACTYGQAPRYADVSVESLPDHTKRYTVCVKNHEDVVLGIGEGASRKAAENEASKKALVYLGRC